MSELHELTASEIIKKIKTEEVSVVEVVSSFLERISRVNPHINAINQVQPERLMSEAKMADNLPKSKKIGKLRGLPISIKDTCHVKGFVCSKSCIGLHKEPSIHDATVVERLRAEGAIILGISNTPELLLSFETDNVLYGRTNNPHNLNYSPGGSSGGEAAIIAAGGSPVGIGSDAGGSIRVPAHYSGISGHKPTTGLVPLTGTIPSDGIGLGSQILSFGPMARSVDDLITIMEIISGYDNKDPHAPPVDFKDPNQVELKKLSVAYFENNPAGGQPPCFETINILNQVIDVLKGEVAIIKKDFPTPVLNILKFQELFIFGGDRGELFKKTIENIGTFPISALTKEFINLAEKSTLNTTEFRQRLVEVEKFRFEMMRFMNQYDILISPVTPTSARLHGSSFFHFFDDSGYVMTHNITGWPATVIPCGFTKEKMPIGIQIAAKPWQDEVALALARKIQSVIGIPKVVLLQ